MNALIRAVVTMAVLAAAVQLPISSADAQESGAGTVVVVDPADRTRVLISGDSETNYRLVLPDGAACPGDSANDDFRVNSFIVPASEDLSQLQFQPIGPQGPTTDSKWALYTDAPNPYSQRLTQVNGASGEPGRLGIFPVMTFSLYPLETLPPGRYAMGIACSPGVAQTTSAYWSTVIEISHDTSVEPPQLNWVVVGPVVDVAEGSSSSSVGNWIALAVLVVGSGAFIALRRRKSCSSETIKERI